MGAANDHDDELNNQGDYISGDVGADGKDVVVGKNIDTRRKQQTNDISFNISPPGRYGPDHPVSQYKLADIVAALLGDPLKGQVGLIARVMQIETAILDMREYQRQAVAERHQLLEEMERMRQNQYPRWFQVLTLVLALTLLIMLAVFLYRMK